MLFLTDFGFPYFGEFCGFTLLSVLPRASVQLRWLREVLVLHVNLLSDICSCFVFSFSVSGFFIKKVIQLTKSQSSLGLSVATNIQTLQTSESICIILNNTL